MNIIDAIRTGKRFRRANVTDVWFLSTTPHHFSVEDVLADDWEIEEQTVTVTRTQILAALYSSHFGQHRPYEDPYEAILNRLGFEEDRTVI